MPRGRQHDDDLTDVDREKIAAIRRELDAEFGALEPAEPLFVEPAPASPRPASSPRGAPSPRPALSPRAAASPRPASSPHPQRRTAARAVPLFLLGALLGGAVGGVTGGLTTLLWLQYSPAPSIERGASMPAGEREKSTPSIERGTAGSDKPAATTPEPLADAALESALSDWLEATKTGDIEQQMRFYPARVPVYYTWRNATRDAVRAEKVRVFGAATRLDITTDAPSIELSDDGDSAVSRFRKRYVIEGPAVRRRGEVLQELRWARTPDGWRIVAERDAEVLQPSASVGPGRARRGGTIDPAR